MYTSSEALAPLSDVVNLNPLENKLILSGGSPSAADGTDDRADILSNGFKIRESSNLMNVSGEQVVYMAFAESPFVNSKGVPTTAR